MPVSVTVKLHGAAELLLSLQRVERTISTGISSSVGRRLGTESLRVVRKLTPRQKSRRFRTGSTSRGFQPFWRQWQLIEEVATSNAYRAVVRNKATRTKQGLIALASIEFGSQAHVIRPGGKYPLRWRQGGSRSEFVGRTLLEFGDTVEEVRSTTRRKPGDVLAWTVNHPGNAAFHMVTDTRVQMQRVSERLLRDFQREIEKSFGPLSVSVR